MELNQNQYYQLEYPVNDEAGEPIPSVQAASFTMWSGSAEVFSQDLCSGGSFTAGVFTVTLNDTSSFSRGYRFEVWVIVDGKKYLTHSGSISFIKTLERVEIC